MKPFDCPPTGAASDCSLCPADIKRQCIPPNKPVPAFHCVGEWDDCKKHRGAGLGCPHVKTCREKTGEVIDAEEANAALVMVAQLRGRSA